MTQQSKTFLNKYPVYVLHFLWVVIFKGLKTKPHEYPQNLFQIRNRFQAIVPHNKAPRCHCWQIEHCPGYP